jgi:hypothetical protein
MSDNEMYPNDLAHDEAELGFQKALVSNPRRKYVGHPSLIPAVLYVLGPMDHIIKIRDPAGNLAYSHRQYGRLGLMDAPDWNPVLMPVPSAAAAIRIAKTGMDQQLAHQSGLRIDPVLPSLDLCCPDCGGHFVVHKDHLGMDEAVICSNCGETNAAPDMLWFESL